jgi:large subunit ribosomal protein L15
MRCKVSYKKKVKRIGRGHGSGHGKTSTKGHKGQHARSGFSMRPGFEGGQTPLYLKVPKRGFNRPFRKKFTVINIDQLSALELDEVSPDSIVGRGISKHLGSGGLKVLGRGELKKKITVHAHCFSASAKAAIEKAGGQVILVENKKV